VDKTGDGTPVSRYIRRVKTCHLSAAVSAEMG
jgi:hypothetical protein